MASNGPTPQMRRRMFVVLAVFFTVGFAIVILKLVDLQIVNSSLYQEKALAQQMRESTIEPSRGTIYDTNMKVLAQSASVWTVNLSPAQIKKDGSGDNSEQAKVIAKGLSEILDVDYDWIIEKTKKTSSYYETIKRRIEQPVADEVRAFLRENNINCVSLAEDTKRYYPYGNFASTVLGFVGTDNQGLAGLEAHYNKTLSGTPGKVVSIKNAKGTDMSHKYEQVYDAQDGYNLVLTIDEVIQHYLETNLEAAITENNVTARGVGIVIDLNTGAILGMTTKPDFDPNSPFEIYDTAAQERLLEYEGTDEYKTQLQLEQQLQWRNKAISDPYEPGSVFKIITAAAALEEKVVTRNTQFYCSGSYEVADRTINCWRSEYGHGQEYFEDALRNSCNPFFMWVGARLGASTFSDYFKAFGMGGKTGIDLPGEADNKNLYHTKLGPVELASSSFGQTFKVTPIQMAASCCAVLNGGYVVQPHIVRQIVDNNGNIVESFDTTVKRQVISRSTSLEMALLLERVVVDGKNGDVLGYRVGGKSGTSEKLDVFDADGKQSGRIASFFGFGPVDDPKVGVLVILDEPHAAINYGSTLTGPVVSQILSDILPYIGIESSYTTEESKYLTTTTPRLEGDTVDRAEQKAENAGLRIKVVGDGDTVVRQMPLGNMAIPNNGLVVVYTEADRDDLMATVPDVSDYTPAAARKTLQGLGLNVQFSGGREDSSGVMVYKQSVEPGEKVAQGTVVTIELRTREAVW